jgi:predicted DNA-binding protein YlxM (UPF0122 family)
LTAYEKDFNAITRAHRTETFEALLANDIFEKNLLAIKTLTSAKDLLEIYQQLSSSVDRAVVREHILGSFSLYAKEFTILADAVSDDVASTHVPALALSGSKLRDDLRQLITQFEQPNLPD